MTNLRTMSMCLAAAALGLTAACSSDGDSDEGSDSTGGIDAAQQAELDEFVETALERYRIPGAAVAIVRGRDVIYEAGFGVRGVEDREPVTAETRFAVASTTKSMTSMMMATLVDEGKLSWDAAMVDLVPGFEVANPESTTRLRLRHLLNHASGAERRNTPLFFESAPPTAFLASLRDLPMSVAPGTTFEYHNQMYAAAGFAAALADGAPFDDEGISRGYAKSMQQRVFSPIGMARTTLDTDVALADENHAWPHSYDGARDAVDAVPIGFERFSRTTVPASAAWSTARDLAAYASTQLGGVAPNGKRVVSAASLEQTHVGTNPEGDGSSYAMGWHERRDGFGDLRAVYHDGDMLGFVAEILLLPEEDLGVVVLANRAVGTYFYRAVERFAVETVLDWEHADDADELAANDEVLAQLRELSASSTVVSREEAEPYLGDYGHGIRVEFGDDGFVLENEFGRQTLVSGGEPGVFLSGGIMNGRFVAAFDDDTEPVALTLDLIFNEGKPQPFMLEKIGQ